MRYLVTGGAGFIGGHLTEALIAEGHSVIVVDDLSTGSEANLETVADNPNLKFIRDDILTMDGLPEILREVDMAFHLAAAVGVELVVQDPARTIATNVHGTERVLSAAIDAGGVKTLVASTSEVYGKSEKESFSETDDLLIGPSTRSRWSYACSKLLDEFYAMACMKSSNLPIIVSRFFNTVGPRQTGRYGMVLPRFAAKALANEPLLVYGDGDQSRCFCHVLDTVDALLKLAVDDDAIGRVFNIGTTRETTINQLAELVIERTGSSSAIRKIPYDEAYEAGFEDMRRRVPNTNAITELTGWKPRRSLENIVDDVANSIRGD
jgi:UDP-glucose 4-epimerase